MEPKDSNRLATAPRQITAEIRRYIHTAHVIANVPSTVLELDAQTFASITVRNPKVLHNVALALIEREHASAKVRLQPARGEAVALVIDDSHLSIASAVVAAFEHASPAAPIVADLGQCLDRRDGRHQANDLPGFLANLDHRLRQADRVLAVIPASDPHLVGLLRHMDRAVLLTSRATSAKLTDKRLSGLTPELFLVGEEASPQPPAGGRVVRTAKPPLSAIDIQWLGRHLSRTKLGLALGAGGRRASRT